MLSQTVHYMIASVLSAAVGLLSAIVFTRLLSPEEYGVYVIGFSTAAIVSALLFTWVRVSALRFQSEGGSVDVRATVLLGYLISTLAAPAALVIAVLTTSASIERSVAAVCLALGLGLFELGQELLKARLQSLAFMSAVITRACIAFTLCLASALLGGGGLGQLAMVTATYFVTALLYAPVIWRRPIARFSLADLHAFSKFGLPLTVSGIVFALHAALDRMLVFHLLGDTAAGHYGAAADLVRQMILIPATSVASATIPIAVRAFADGGTEEARPHLELGFEVLLATALPAAVGLAITSRDISAVLLGREFSETAAQIMPVLAFAWLFQTISQSYVHTSFYLAKRPVLTTVQGLGMLIVNVLMMPLLIARLGLTGAALGLVLTEAFGLSFGWFLTGRACRLPFNAFHVLRIGAATALMAAALTMLRPLLTPSIASLCILVGSGCLTYLLAAITFDIAGIRAAAVAYGWQALRRLSRPLRPARGTVAASRPRPHEGRYRPS